MKLIIKALLGLALLVVIVLGAAGIMLANFDPNDYKDWIAAKVKDNTGRDITIDGNISLTYYPWLGVEVENVHLSNAPGFGDKPFLSTEFVKARAKLLPLLRKKLEMDTLVLHGATIHLAKNADGVTNWVDISSPTESRSSSDGMPFAALALGGIDIKDAAIHWNDQQQGVSYSITQGNISTGELVLNAPIEIKAGMTIKANQPALESAVNFLGTVQYEDSGDVLVMQPLRLKADVKGKSIPGGKATLALITEVRVDMANETVAINAIDLSAFDTELSGKLQVSNFQSGKPLVNGNLSVKGDDLPQLFRIFEIEPLASQLAGLPNKTFDIATIFDANMARNDIVINSLEMIVLGNTVSAEIVVRNAQSDKPSAKGRIDASGPNLPILISIASQLQGVTEKKFSALASQLVKAPKSFVIASKFDVDMQAGTVNIPNIAIDALGTKTEGRIVGSQLDSSSPSLNGGVSVKGENLPVLVGIAVAYSGDGSEDIGFLTKRLKSVPKSFAVNTQFDSGGDAIEISQMSIDALGIKSEGQFKIKNAMSDVRSLSGMLDASGPDLPLLMLVAGSLQKESGLTALAKDLSKIKDKSFKLNMSFATDSGSIDLPSISFNSLGVTLSGDLKGASGNLKGKLGVSSESPRALLNAMGRPGFAQVLKQVNVDIGINGSVGKIELKPLSLKAVVAGKQIPNSPVTLNVNADTVLDQDKETLTLKEFSINGLNLDVKGSLTASNYKTDPTFKGDINVAPFNLHQFMKSLKQDPPVTADPNVLQKVALSSMFSGTGGSLVLKGLKAEMDDSRLQGDISLNNITPLNLEFGLSIDRLNLDRYLPPAADDAKTSDKAAATPETLAAVAATEIPVETLRALNVKGDFVMSEFIFSNAKLSDLELNIRASDGNIKLNPIAARLYDGSYKGYINLNATGKELVLTTNSTLNGVQIEPLLADFTGTSQIAGEANINLALNSSGLDTNKLKQRLGGKGEIKFLEGVFRGVDIPKVLRQIEIMYESKRFGKIDKEGSTEFDSLTAKMDINNGVVRNEDMLMIGRGFDVKGRGVMVNLNDETWKYNLNVIVNAASATRGEQSYNLGGYDILIKCRGKIVDRRCLPDIESMINAVLKDTVKDKIQNKIGDAIGIDLQGLTRSRRETTRQPAQPAQEHAPAEQQQEQNESQDPVKNIIDNAGKKLLDKLF